MKKLIDCMLPHGGKILSRVFTPFWVAAALLAGVAKDVQAQAPPNDNLTNAQALVGSSGVVYGDNINATAETYTATNGVTTNEPAPFISPAQSTVWYLWTAPITTTMDFSTRYSTDPNGNELGTVMAVYTLKGTNLAYTNLTLIASNEYDPSSGFTNGNVDVTSRVDVPVSMGQVYLIQVDGSTNNALNGQANGTAAQGYLEFNWGPSLVGGNFTFSAKTYYTGEFDDLLYVGYSPNSLSPSLHATAGTNNIRITVARNGGYTGRCEVTLLVTNSIYTNSLVTNTTGTNYYITNYDTNMNFLSFTNIYITNVATDYRVQNAVNSGNSSFSSSAPSFNYVDVTSLYTLMVTNFNGSIYPPGFAQVPYTNFFVLNQTVSSGPVTNGSVVTITTTQTFSITTTTNFSTPAASNKVDYVAYSNVLVFNDFQMSQDVYLQINPMTTFLAGPDYPDINSNYTYAGVNPLLKMTLTNAVLDPYEDPDVTPPTISTNGATAYLDILNFYGVPHGQITNTQPGSYETINLERSTARVNKPAAGLTNMAYIYAVLTPQPALGTTYTCHYSIDCPAATAGFVGSPNQGFDDNSFQTTALADYAVPAWDAQVNNAGQNIFSAADFGDPISDPNDPSGNNAGKNTIFPAETAYVGTITFGPYANSGVTTLAEIGIPIYNPGGTEFDMDMNLQLYETVADHNANTNQTPTGGGVLPGVIGNISSANITINYSGPPGGTYDTSFNPSGSPTLSYPPNNSTPGANPPFQGGGVVQAVAMQPNGQAIIGGYFTTYNTTPVYGIARLLTNGWLDTSFNNVNDGGVNGTVRTIVLDANSNIIIGGSFSSYDGNHTPTPNIARLTPTGALDTSFKIGSGFNSTVYALAVDTNGNILVGGDFTQYNSTNCNHLVRLLPSGGLDPTFYPNTGNGVSTIGTDQDVRAIALDSAGNIIIGGDFSYVNGTNLNYLARLLPSGHLDPSYAPNGGPDDSIYTIAIETNNNNEMVIGGAFQNYNASSSPGVALITYNGALDTTFPVGAGADGNVYSVVIETNGDILVGGQFRNFNLTRRLGIVRLLTNGWVDTSFMDTAYNQYAGLINAYYSPSTEPIHTAWALAVQPDGNIIVGGSFTNIGGGGSRTSIGSQINVTRIIGAPTAGPMAANGGIGNCPGNITLTQNPYTVNDTAGKLFLTLARVNGSLGPAQVTIGTNTLAPGSGSATAADFGLSFPSMPLYNTIYAVGWNIRPYGSYGWRQGDGYYGENTAYQPTYSDSGDSSININIYDDLNAQNNLFADLSLLNITELNITNNGNGTPPYAGPLVLGGVTVPMYPALGLPAAQLEIINNNFPVGKIGFSQTNYTAVNTSNTVTITVQRTNGISGPISVTYYTANGTAIAGNNYTPVTLGQNKTLNFSGGANNNTASFTIPILNSSLAQGSKFFRIFLTNSSPSGVLDTNVPPVLPSSATVTIIDGNFTAGHLSFTSPTYSVSKTGVASIGVERVGGAVGQLTVQCATSNGTAIGGVNFVPTVTNLSWGDQDVSVKTMSVQTLQDTNVDGPLYVNLNLFNATNVGNTQNDGQILYPPTNATLTINDINSYGNLNFAAPNFNVLQNGAQAVITVVRTIGTTGAISVQYSTANDTNPPPGYQTAIAGNNYGAVSGTLTLGPGVSSATFSVPVYYTPAETNVANRVVLLALNASSTNIAGQFPQYATLTILDPQLVVSSAGAVDLTTQNGTGFNSFVSSLVLQPDGNLLAGGNFTFFNHYPFEYLGRLTTQGASDTSFLFDQSGANGQVFQLLMQLTNALQTGNGPIIASGNFTTMDGVNRNGIARVNTDGSIDETFDPGSGADSTITSMIQTLLPTGSGNRTNLAVYIGGNFAHFDNISCGGIARLNASTNSPGYQGTVDTTFSPGQGITSAGSINALAVQPDNSVIAGGSFTTFNNVAHNHLIRLDSAGVVDPSFNPGAGSNTSDPVQAVVVQPDGKILIGGSFTNVTVSNVTYNYNYLARLNGDGTVDTNFNVGVGGNNAVLTLALDAEQRIIVGGTFTRFSGVTRSGITRLNSDGTVDPTINFESGADGGFVDTIAIQPNDEINVGGGFSTFEGASENNFVRLYGGANSGTGSIQFSLGTYGVLQNGTNALITLQRLGGEGSSNEPPVTVEFSTSDGSGQAGVDYTNVVTNVTFPTGETYVTVLVPIIDSFIPGANKTVNLTLSSPSNTVIGSIATATLYITNVSSALEFSAAAYRDSANVPSGYASIPVLRIGNPASTISVTVYTGTNGTATPYTNYTPTTNVLTFGPGVTNLNFNVPILNATNMFSDQTVDIEMAAPVNTTTNAPSSALLTIASVLTSPGVLSFSQPSYAVSEGATNAVITILRTNGSSGSVSITLTTSNITALAGVNYQTVSVTNTFASGSTTPQYVYIPVYQQSNAGPDLTVLLTLSNPQPPQNQGGPTIGGSNPEVLTILNNIEYFSFAQPTYSVLDGNILSVYVNRGGTLTNTATVNYTTYTQPGQVQSNGWAVAGSDYIASSGTLTFGSNVTQQSIPIQVLQPNVPYPPLKFQVVLSSPTVSNSPQTMIQLASPSNTTITINSDLTAYELATNAYSIGENGSNLVVTVYRLYTTNPPGSVQFATANGISTNTALNALSNIDYIGTNGVLTFTNGQISNTFTVPILNSNVVEGNKMFSVYLTNPLVNSGTAYVIAPSNALVTITNNLTGLAFGAGSYVVSECTSEQAFIPVFLSGSTNQTVSASFATSNGTAISGVNYFATNGTLTFAPGQTSTNIVVNLIGNHNGPNITVNLYLTTPSNALLLAPSNTVLTLVECNGITNFNVSSFASSAIISWSTPTPATARVGYGLTTNFTTYTSWSSLTTNPVVILTGLARDTVYYFEAFSQEGGTVYTTNGSFTTSNTLILNTLDASYSGLWSPGSASVSNYYGSGYYVATTIPTYNQPATATYTPNIPTPGLYNVYAWYPQSSNFSTKTPINVTGLSNYVANNVNQTANGGTWRQMATNIYFGQGLNGTVVIANNTGDTNKLVAANATMWSYVTNQDYTTNFPAWYSSWWSNFLAAHPNETYAISQNGLTLVAQKVGSNITLTWPFGALYQATNVSGPWTAIPTATPPYTTNTPAGRKFYRIRVGP